MQRLTFAAPPAGGLHILALGAHPDDIEIGCGGTLLRLIADGHVASVRWVVFSGSGPRAEEAMAGANAILDGVSDREVILRDERDGYFGLTGVAIKEAFEDLKRGPGPDLILTHRRADRHQDHRFISDLTWQTFRDNLVLEYEIPKYDGDPADPNVYVDIPDRLVQRKIEILESAFSSQRDRDWFDAETFRSMLRLRGIECRAGSGYAEAFEGRKLVL